MQGYIMHYKSFHGVHENTPSTEYTHLYHTVFEIGATPYHSRADCMVIQIFPIFTPSTRNNMRPNPDFGACTVVASTPYVYISYHPVCSSAS